MTEHVCEVCFLPSWRHRDPGYLSPRCCHGCACGVTMPPVSEAKSAPTPRLANKSPSEPKESR